MSKHLSYKGLQEKCAAILVGWLLECFGSTSQCVYNS